MQTMITMKYSEKSYMPSIYAERYGIVYKEIRADEYVFIDIPIDEYIINKNTILTLEDMFSKILRAEPVDIYITDNIVKGNSLIKIELALVDYYMKKFDEKHYSKKVRNFYKKHGISIDGYLPETEYNSDGNCVLVSCTDTGNKKVSVVRNFSFEYLCDVCELYRDFSDGKDLNIDDLYLIASNLRIVGGGKKKFLGTVRNNDIEWAGIFAAFRKSNIENFNCEMCGYRNKCDHCENMIVTAKPESNQIVRLKEEEYCTLKEAESDLFHSFISAVYSRDNDIHIIKAQTSLGKTRMIIDFMKQNPEQKFIIVAPTHNLKNQIYVDARNIGITHIFNTPDIKEYRISDEIMEQVECYYKIGAGMKVIPFLRKIRSRLCENEPDYRNISMYLDECEKAKNYDGNIVTSHSRFLYMNLEKYADYQVIIDEDIMRTLLGIESFSINKLEQIKGNLNLPAPVVSKIDTLCNCKTSGKKKYIRCGRIGSLKGVFGDITDFDKVDVNLYGLLQAECFAVDDEYVYFLDEKFLPETKMIIMSATVDVELYRLLYRYRKIHFYECRKAEYMGRVVQYTDYSYSRFFFNENEKIIDELRKRTENQVVITLSCIEHKFNTKYHFGNVEGLNDSRGKDIAVIGLPNLSNVVYGLYAMRMGYVGDVHMCCRRIQYNNYDFRLNTFEDKIIRRIQLWLLSSQLEQAVGRARLLRENCTVTVFSGFPVEQAEFHNTYDN
ncbi:MAG: DEAD/DEAH box helicase family protein [Ruminococcus flavefaciens]|nr:DEAD/DEAH box helicase family protein [Ruminococcus flavefaciens]